MLDSRRRIKLYRYGVAEAYTGSRNADGIVTYLRQSSTFSLPELKTADDLARLAKASKHPIVVGLFRQPVAASAFYRVFRDAALQAHLGGEPVTFAYSASYSTPPVMPTWGKKKPTVPGLALLAPGKAADAKALLPMPRKKEEFKVEVIAAWLSAHGFDVSINSPRVDTENTDFYPPDGEEPPEDEDLVDEDDDTPKESDYFGDDVDEVEDYD